MLGREANQRPKCDPETSGLKRNLESRKRNTQMRYNLLVGLQCSYLLKSLN